jgi:hypothetical protein
VVGCLVSWVLCGLSKGGREERLFCIGREK